MRSILYLIFLTFIFTFLCFLCSFKFLNEFCIGFCCFFISNKIVRFLWHFLGEDSDEDLEGDTSK